MIINIRFLSLNQYQTTNEFSRKKNIYNSFLNTMNFNIFEVEFAWLGFLHFNNIKEI